MNTEDDLDGVIRDWLETGPTRLSDRVAQAARLGVSRTRQRHSLRRSLRWPAGRPARIAFVAGAIVILVVAGAAGLRLLQTRDAIGGPLPSPSQSAASAPIRVQLTFRAQPVGSTSPDAAAMAAIRTIVQRRLEAAGFVDPIVTVEGADRIGVDLPQGTDLGQVQPLALRRGELAFVPLPADRYGTSVTTNGPTDVTDGQPLPDDPTLVPLFTGDHVSSARPSTDENGQPVVEFQLDPTATRLFADYTSAHVGDYFAIVLDGVVVTAPSIRSAITSGDGAITMGAEPDAVTAMNDLVSFLRYGALPFPLRLEAPIASPSVSP